MKKRLIVTFVLSVIGIAPAQQMQPWLTRSPITRVRAGTPMRRY